MRVTRPGGASRASLTTVAAAVARQIERDNLNELIAVAEAEHGPVTEEEVRARREELRQARTEQGHPRSGAA